MSKRMFQKFGWWYRQMPISPVHRVGSRHAEGGSRLQLYPEKMSRSRRRTYRRGVGRFSGRIAGQPPSAGRRARAFREVRAVSCAEATPRASQSTRRFLLCGRQSRDRKVRQAERTESGGVARRGRRFLHSSERLRRRRRPPPLRAFELSRASDAGLERGVRDGSAQARRLPRSRCRGGVGDLGRSARRSVVAFAKRPQGASQAGTSIQSWWSSTISAQSRTFVSARGRERFRSVQQLGRRGGKDAYCT